MSSLRYYWRRSKILHIQPYLLTSSSLTHRRLLQVGKKARKCVPPGKIFLSLCNSLSDKGLHNDGSIVSKVDKAV